MRKQAEKKLFDIVKNANNADIETIITNARQADLKIWQATKQPANHAKEILECFLYSKFEDEKKAIKFEFDKMTSATVFVGLLPYILGVTSFNIEYERNAQDYKESKLNLIVNLKRPYGGYKASLELYGLTFADETSEEKTILTDEQMQALNEANSLLASCGLKQIAYDIN